ncbi:N-acetylmuramic acid 6-phosphate etherase [Candidatus Epulonipiscium viviparus]|uniref:N-acetylmuramic acid 6-phosphate etherase n=1 Tax=Candidatus Epulonipiscium viviparus TaxID=420336 RepID=UPI00016C0C33|nr:N-acetylmuramic acid 6-phosphate etherase [Candidatus Epulopiscium viviparus]
MEIKQLNLAGLTTEANNQDTINIDSVSTLELVKLINAQDRLVAQAVGKEADKIATAVEYITDAFKKGGRLFYFGAGTSGRLGVLDASECTPTFGTDPEMVQGYIAGGDAALRNPVEGAEDSFIDGVNIVEKLAITEKDVVVGITASGRTKYVLGAISAANKLGCVTVGVCNNANSELHSVTKITIAPDVGPEVVQGSTRMKSGTSQKLVLNMLTTGSMIKLGKVYKNYMVDMKPSNEKLLDRAVRLVMQTTGCEQSIAMSTLSQCNFHVKIAIVMIMLSCDRDKAVELLENSGGYVRSAIEE